MGSVENAILGAIIERSHLEKIIENRKYNENIISHYKNAINDLDFLNNFGSDYKITLSNIYENVSNCNKIWSFDFYKEQNIKDIKNQSLCKNKFCSNCKKVKQAIRMAKYIPELEKYKGNLYHLVLTVPNCSGEDLRSTILHMNKCFRRLIHIVGCKTKINNLDFNSWGYQGAVRSLEVTFNGKSYHPHFHIAIALNSDVLSNKNIMEDTFSFSKRKNSCVKRLVRVFCEEEILIQKIWYLLINDIRVTEKNIRTLERGYSCIIDKFEENNYAELFKYITKDKDEKGNIISYENFKDLYISLYRLKQIQGYGCFYSIADDFDIEEYDLFYNDLIAFLRQKENPSRGWSPIEEFLADKSTLISRKTAFRYLNSVLIE